MDVKHRRNQPVLGFGVTGLGFDWHGYKWFLLDGYKFILTDVACACL